MFFKMLYAFYYDFVDICRYCFFFPCSFIFGIHTWTSSCFYNWWHVNDFVVPGGTKGAEPQGSAAFSGGGDGGCIE